MVAARLRGRPGRDGLPGTGVGQDRPDAGERSPWDELRERRLKLPRCQPGVRAVVVVGALLLVTAGAVLSFGRFFPQVRFLSATASGIQQVTTPADTLQVSWAITVLAWTLVIAGLFLARWQVRLAGLVLLAGAAAAERHEMGTTSLFGGVAGLAAIGAILLLGLVTVACDVRALRGKRAPDPRGRLWAPLITVAVCLLVALAYWDQATRLDRISGITVRPTWFLELVNIVVFLVLPMLLIAGSDVADAGEALARAVIWSLTGQRSAPALTRRRRAAALTLWLRALALALRRHALVLAAGLAAIVVATIVLTQGTGILLPTLATVPVLAVIAVIAARSGPFGRWAKPLPALVAAGVAFWFLVIGQVHLGLAKIPPIPPRIRLAVALVDQGPPAFSFRVPRGCPGQPAALAVPRGTGAAISNCLQVPSLFFEVWTSPGEVGDACALPRAVLRQQGSPTARYVRARRDGQWRTCLVADPVNRLAGVAWTRLANGRTWMVAALDDNMPGVFETYAPLMRQMRHSLRLSLTPAPVPPLLLPVATARAIAAVVRHTRIAWAALAAAAGIGLVLRRRRSGKLDHGLLFFTCAGAWIGLPGLGAEAVGVPVGPVLTAEVSGLAALAAAATLGYIAVLLLRARTGGRPGARVTPGQQAERLAPYPDRLSALLGLGMTLLAVWAATSLYGGASRAGESVPVVAGVILTLALLWELGFSGEILNPGSPRSAFPHRARIIAYLGYLLLVAAAVLQLGTIRSAASGAPAGGFDPEVFVQDGIVLIGVPFAITAFLIRWFSTASAGPAQGRA